MYIGLQRLLTPEIHALINKNPGVTDALIQNLAHSIRSTASARRLVTRWYGTWHTYRYTESETSKLLGSTGGCPYIRNSSWILRTLAQSEWTSFLRQRKCVTRTPDSQRRGSSTIWRCWWKWRLQKKKRVCSGTQPELGGLQDWVFKDRKKGRKRMSPTLLLSLLHLVPVLPPPPTHHPPLQLQMRKTQLPIEVLNDSVSRGLLLSLQFFLFSNSSSLVLCWHIIQTPGSNPSPCPLQTVCCFSFADNQVSELQFVRLETCVCFHFARFSSGVPTDCLWLSRARVSARLGLPNQSVSERTTSCNFCTISTKYKCDWRHPVGFLKYFLSSNIGSCC